MTSKTAPGRVAQAFLNAVSDGDGTADEREAIAALSAASLDGLSCDEMIAFWVNLYNAFVQDDLRRHPERYYDRRAFFRERRHTVAGTDLNLDSIEHGILRHSKWKYGLGYIPNPFPSAFERRHRLPEIDPRVHFALNCGAESCPPIAVYSAETLDTDLNVSARGFLEATTSYDSAADVLRVSRVFLWYRGDFGGRRGIRRLLRKYDVHPDGNPKTRYDEWDWTMKRGFYRSDNELVNR
jgi:hypothetical protein